MEEDIKILENLKQYLQLKIDSGEHKIIYNDLLHDEKTVDCLYALENLIKGYKELEGKLDTSRKANEFLNKTNNELRWEIRTTYSKVVNDIISKFNLGDDYIPKSKIREKIEKYEEMRKATYTDLTHYGDSRRDTVLEVLQVLQELMEE